MGWFERRPAWGVAATLSLVATGLGALAASLVAVVVAAQRVSHSAGSVHTLASAVLVASVAVFAAVVLAVVGGGLLSLLGRAAPEIWRDRAFRRAMADALVSPASADGADTEGAGEPAVVVVDGDWPLALAVPGRRGVVLVTAGLSRCLSPDQLAAVVAHERTHLKWWHATVSRWAALLAATLPGSARALRLRHWMDLLLELVADDAAARRVGLGPTAEALGILGALRGEDQLVVRSRRLAAQLD